MHANFPMIKKNNGLSYAQFVEAIAALEPETIIRFDFGYFTPKGFHSYRGYYEDLAIGYVDDAYDKLTAGEYLKELKAMKGGTLEGYKGGGGTVFDGTTVWVSKDYSECTGTVIKSVTDLEYGYAIINTAYYKD